MPSKQRFVLRSRDPLQNRSHAQVTTGASMDIDTDHFSKLKDAGYPDRLIHAIEELSLRGLVQSASWLSQILASVQDDDDQLPEPSGKKEAINDDTRGTPAVPPRYAPARRRAYMLGKGLFDCRQYRRAASVLEGLQTPHARFLRLYSIFLAGEKRKDEERHELGDMTEPANMELDSLRDELTELRATQKLDAHLWYLLGVVLKRLKLANDAVEALERSLTLFPYNWGAWLELAPLVENREALLSLKVRDGWMKMFFVANFLNETDEADEARQVYERALQVLPASTFVRVQLAFALYNIRRFDEAQQLYEDAYMDDPYSLDGVDIYSNILYVKEDKVQLSLLANRCMKIDKFRLETCCVIGNYYSLRGQHEQAVSYFQRALKLNRNYLSAWTLMGHEFLEMKNTAAAVEAYRRAVDINPKDFRAWYGLGQTYELLSMPQYTLYYYQKAAALRPKDVRMWCAIGQTFEELSRQDEAIRCYERARRCDDHDSQALAKLAYLYERMARQALSDGRQQELAGLYSEKAAECHLAHLTRLQEDKVHGPESVEALKFLAEHFFAKNDMQQAEKYCYRLMNYSGHDKDLAKKLLRQIHNRGSH